MINKRKKQTYTMLETISAMEEEKKRKGLGSPGCGALFTVGLFI